MNRAGIVEMLEVVAGFATKNGMIANAEIVRGGVIEITRLRAELEAVKSLATLAVTREREECAKIATHGRFRELHPISDNGYGFYKAGVEDARFNIAAAIRSRSNIGEGK